MKKYLTHAIRMLEFKKKRTILNVQIPNHILNNQPLFYCKKRTWKAEITGNVAKWERKQ